MKPEPIKHATVVRDGYTVPLIGITPEAVLEECDLCHDLVPMMEVIWTGTQTLCRKCEGIKASSPVI